MRYRVGEMLLSATGSFSADSGRSIFLEQHLEQRGSRKYFRWEIPYPYIHSIEAEAKVEATDGVHPDPPRGDSNQKAAAAGAGESAGGGSSVLRFPQRPKTA